MKELGVYSRRKVNCNKEAFYYELRFSVFPQSGDHRRRVTVEVIS